MKNLYIPTAFQALDANLIDERAGFIKKHMSRRSANDKIEKQFLKCLVYNILIGMILMLMGCSKVKIEDYNNQSPNLQIQEYFNGQLQAHGILQDWKGLVTRKFHVTIDASWVENKGIFKEFFIFDDGETQERIWHIDLIDKNNFTASAADVVGIAQGKQFGNAVNMNYVLKIPYNGSTMDLKMDDWMYLLDNEVLLNKTTMKKFGFTVGNLTIFFTKNKIIK